MKNYTYDEILARVLAGDDPQTIADEIADNLNSALKAAQETKSKEKERLADLQAVADSVNRYMDKYYPWFDGKVTPEQLQESLKTIDEMMEIFKPAFTKSKKEESKCANSSCDCKSQSARPKTLHDLLAEILH